MKRIVVWTMFLVTSLAATSIAAMDYLVTPITAASDNLTPAPLLLLGLLLIGAGLLQRSSHPSS